MTDVESVPPGEFSRKSKPYEGKQYASSGENIVGMNIHEKENVSRPTEITQLGQPPSTATSTPSEENPVLVNGVMHEEDEKEREKANESDHPSFKIVSVDDNHELEYETGLLDEMMDEYDDEEDEVISFEVPSTMAKPVAVTQVLPSASSQGSNRLRNLTNGGLTLNLQSPQILSTSPTKTDGSSSPSVGRFKVTTCQNESGKSQTKVEQVAESEPPPAAPQPKDERLMTPIERLQLYVDNPNMVCRNGVAVQYVNFVKDAEDPEAFLAASAKLFERLVQDADSQVRVAFLEQIPNIVRGYKPTFKKLRMMSFLGDCIRDDNYNVRRLAQVAIGQLVEFAPDLMTRETITASVVPLLIQIFYAEATADLMIDALNLFCKLLDKVGPEPVKRLFVPEFNKLCNHDIAQIRQVCAQNFPFVVRYFVVTQAEEFDENDEHCRMIQDRVVQLSRDFAWHVRETVAGVFPQVIEICHKRWPAFTNRTLYPSYSNLLNDQAKQVRRWAARGLGRVIACSADPSKTRLHITTNGTVEFVPPPSFSAYRFSESEDFDRRSDGGTGDGRERGRGLLQNRPLSAVSSSPALSQVTGQSRRNYYNRLGIVTSLSHALSETEEKKKAEEKPDFYCYQYWQSPIGQVAVVGSEKIPVIVEEVSELSSDVAADGKETVAEDESIKEDGPSMEAKDELVSSQEESLDTPREDDDKDSRFIPEEKIENENILEKEANASSDNKPAPTETESSDKVDVLVEDLEKQVLALDPDAEIVDPDLEEQPMEERAEDLKSNGISRDDPSAKWSELFRDTILAPDSPDEPSARTVGAQAGTTPEKVVSPSQDSLLSDDSHSFSSTSSMSPDLSSTFTVQTGSGQVPFASSYEIDPFIIDKHMRRDKAVMMQLKEAGEVAGRLEDILPNVKFLQEFLSLSKDSEKEVVIQVAMDFPAVALTVGRQFWPELHECHRTLASTNIMPARELIAASLPRIAEIVGHYYTLVDLVPLVNEFLKDTDSVRLNMIENYSAFIMRLPAEIRPLHLLRLCEFFSPDEERNWRYRQACAEQIAHLALLFPSKLVVRNLMDGAWFFARDRTAEVRKSACVALSSIFMRIEQQRDVASREIFLKKLELFLRNDEFRSRQVFAQFCEDLLSKAALSFDAFTLHFGDRFWPLFDSNVVAVRLAATRCLLYIPQSARKHSLFGRAMEKLAKDTSRTIQENYQLVLAASGGVAPSVSLSNS